MTHEEIIAMAREAGINLSPAQFSGVQEAETDEFALAKLAALAVAKEREACAKLCDREFEQWIDKTDDGAVAVKSCASAIRARGAA